MAMINEYYEQAQLSMAAYAEGLEPGMFGVRDDYINALVGTGNMSTKQAEEFASTYAVVDQYTDFITGLSVTVFDKSGEKYIAVRGTESTASFSTAIDWVSANAADVGADGIAISQGLELFNYLQRLYGAAGTTVPQYTYLETTESIYPLTTAEATGLLSGESDPMSVTGHSLGGHLAMIMSRMAPSIVDSVYTFNSPGFDTALNVLLDPLTSDGFFEALQNAISLPITGLIAPDWNSVSSIMTHLDVPGDIISEIGTTPGSPSLIFTESANQGPIDAHSIVGIVDSLAVYSLLATFDPTLTLDKIDSLLKAASHEAEKSLEVIVNAVGDLLVQGSEVNPDIRNELYERIAAIRDELFVDPNAATPILEAKYQNLQIIDLSAIDAAGIETGGQASIAYRYALVHLNPFVITGNDSLYDQHNQNHELDLYDSSDAEGEEGHLTNRYIEDRAAFLALKNQLSTDDEMGTGTHFYWSQTASQNYAL